MVSNYATATIKQKLFMRKRHEPYKTQKLSRGESLEQTLQERGNSKRGNFYLKVKSVWGNTSQTFEISISDSGSHLEIQVILRLLHLWSTKIPVGKAQDE